ncbi:hypothetical protein M6B38_103305 [Iris pallida]|uniref:Uncharacterized protein n=1 Tax=Iris pallida TaxID=29817 RepID=A0AAX6FCQ5_IRIPA|nr:hypothetical protein M6B38_103305 [Iris pallida]
MSKSLFVSKGLSFKDGMETLYLVRTSMLGGALGL